MSDAIRVSLSPERVEVMPNGDPVEVTITITNTGATVDQYAVELDRLPTTWYTLSNTSVALFPQDHEEAKLVIHPPRGATVTAGTYPYTVTVLSRADPTQTNRIEGTVQIGAVTAFEMAIAPARVVGRRARYALSLRNGGNAELEVALEATDADESCRYRFHPAAPRVAAGQKAQVTLHVRARRSSIAGTRKSFEFKVKATPSAGEARTVQGTFVHKPLFRTWQPVRRLAFLLIVLAALVGATVALGGPSGVRTHLSSAQVSSADFLCRHGHLFCTATTALGRLPIHRPHGPGGHSTATPTTALHHPPATVAHTPPPAGTVYPFIGAFDDFHRHAPRIVGAALELEHTSSRVATQLTTNGMLLFDRKDGHTYLVTHDDTVYEFYNNVTQQVR